MGVDPSPSPHPQPLGLSFLICEKDPEQPLLRAGRYEDAVSSRLESWSLAGPWHHLPAPRHALHAGRLERRLCL